MVSVWQRSWIGRVCRRLLIWASAQHWIAVLIATHVWLLWSMAAWAVHAVQPEPYMDEIFHIPQAQAWCAGKWSM